MRTVMLFLLGVGLGLWLRDILYPRSPRLSSVGSTAEPESLRTITGIGPVFEDALHALGIYTIAQLARQDADTLAARLDAPATAERIRRERWIEQAKERSGA